MTTVTNRAPRTHLPHVVPVAHLEQAIVDLIKETGPISITDIGDALSFSPHAIRKRLLALEQANRIHRVRQTISTSGRGCLRYVWKLGPFMPSAAQAQAAKTRNIVRCKAGQGAELPKRQNVTTAYPTVGRRDPLVSALFGPARQEAA